jgi:hypothetical protein
MHSTRRKRIVNLALENLALFGEDDLLAELFETEQPDILREPTRREIEVSRRIMFAPTNDEMEAIQKPGKQGNWRTKELVTLALNFLQHRLDSGDLENDFYYEGERESLVDTHLTQDGVSFRQPSSEEIETLLDEEIDNIAKLLPPVNPPQVGWDVYDYVESETELPARRELIDTVFYGADCNREYVTRSLIGHDGYNPSIVCVP